MLDYIRRRGIWTIKDLQEDGRFTLHAVRKEFVKWSVARDLSHFVPEFTDDYIKKLVWSFNITSIRKYVKFRNRGNNKYICPSVTRLLRLTNCSRWSEFKLKYIDTRPTVLVSKLIERVNEESKKKDRKIDKRWFGKDGIPDFEVYKRHGLTLEVLKELYKLRI